MEWRDENGKFRKPKELIPGQPNYPSSTEIKKNQEFWKKRSMTYLGRRIFFDQDIKDGKCYLCKHEGKAQKKERTVLHHLLYEHGDKLAWTIELCTSCHYWIDEYNKKKIDGRYGRKSKSAFSILNKK